MRNRKLTAVEVKTDLWGPSREEKKGKLELSRSHVPLTWPLRCSFVHAYEHALSLSLDPLASWPLA